ncbi:966_t:CDS:2 [Funneliformis mosseae]|uniref:966_t:CDS:1 n=1 Tax=Funneliformis mosseae TaxID=27381 RepID=A0A9N9AVQ8_FUNMO|nr:966_t:CDS:2 [Funneliformis mosseae]
MEFKIIKYSQYKEIDKANLCKFDDNNFIFVAISYVIEMDLHVKKDESVIDIDDQITIDNNKRKQPLNGKTIIYKVILDSSKQEKIKPYKKEEIGGIVSFVYEKNNFSKADCFIFNAKGIYRLSFSLKNFDYFKYPKILMDELDTLFKNKSILRIKNCIFDHYFYIEQYREGIQVMQLYDLRTMQIQQIFNIYEEKNYSNKNSKSILAISENEQMIAFSSGYGKLALYLIENGLEIIHKDFGRDTKIIASDFKDDNKLMIIIKKAKHQGVNILLWNLYTNEYQYNIPLNKVDISSFNSAKIPGKYVSVNKNGSILSIYDSLHSLVSMKDANNPTPKFIIYRDGKVPTEMNVLKFDNNIVYHQDLSKKEAHILKDNIEPWTTDNYEKIWVYLDSKESMQLYIGKYTIQIWCKIEQKENFVLKYFWATEDYKLRIFELDIYENGFSLKLENNIQIKWFYNDDDINLIKHACDSLEYLIYQRYKLIGFENQHVFEEIKYNISLIVWKFIRNYPNIWKVLDIHYNLIAKIIIGGTNTLIKFILFGDEKVKLKYLHIPRISRWISSEKITKINDNLKKPTKEKINLSKFSDLQLAIKMCESGDIERNRRILIVTYLLEYYTKNAIENHGWLITISKALPDLYTFKLEYFVSELFYKTCMEGIEISNIIEYMDFMPKNFHIISKKFIAFKPNSNFKSTSVPGLNFTALRNYVKIFSNDHENYFPVVKIVPLHNFTVNRISQKTYDYEGSFIIKILKLLFIPRGYFINNSDIAENFSQLSPFVQIVRLESNDIFNNPVMEAVINYKWRPARNYFLRLFFMYILFAACFATICGNYVAHSEITGSHYLASTILAIFVMSYCVIPSFNTKNAFANAKTSQENTIAISFSILLLWFEFILYLRLLSEPAKYIYIMLNIIKETWIFLSFMILVMAGLAHSFLLLLQYPDFTNLTENSSSSTLFTGDSTELKIQNDFDRTEDNPAKNFITSFLSTYNWLNGNFLQQDTWNLWAVKVITFIGSILLVTILQNMYIAFMGGVYSKAYEKGRVALLRFRAESISDYEALDEIYFYPPSPEPKYIYYIGKSKSYNEWVANVKKYKKRNLYEDYEKKMFERKLTYEDEEDDCSGDVDSSESEIKNEKTSIKELNSKLVKKGKENEISITELDNKVAKEEDINIINDLYKKINDFNTKINDLNTKMNDFNIINNSRNDELNSKIDKLLNAIIK